MEKVGGPLKELLARLRLTEPMEGWRAVELWPDVVGERIAARARAVGFRGGVLVVEVENPVWMSELTYLRKRLIEELNRQLGRDIVQEIHLRPAGRRGGPQPDPPGAS